MICALFVISRTISNLHTSCPNCIQWLALERIELITSTGRGISEERNLHIPYNIRMMGDNTPFILPRPTLLAALSIQMLELSSACSAINWRENFASTLPHLWAKQPLSRRGIVSFTWLQCREGIRWGTAILCDEDVREQLLRRWRVFTVVTTN